MKRVLVTGSTGAIGPLVVQAFVAAGWQVATMSRSSATAGELPAGCEEFVSDLFNEQGLARAVAGAQTVVHLAGLLHVMDAPASLGPEYARVNVEGTRRVVAAAQAAGVTRVVLASTVAVYGPTNGRIVDETALPAPDSDYGTSKIAAEQHILAATQADGTPLGVVLRLAAVYGGRIKGNYEKLVRSLARGHFVPIGAGTNHRTLVHEQDAARAFVLAAEHPVAPGRIFNVTDGRIHTVSEITTAICRALGRPAPRWQVPIGAAMLAAASVEHVSAMLGRRPPVTRRTLAKYLESVEVSGDALARELGFTPQWELESGWQGAIREMRRAGRA